MSFLAKIKGGGAVTTDSLREELDLFARNALRDELVILRQDIVSELTGSSLLRIDRGTQEEKFHSRRNQRDSSTARQHAAPPMLAVNHFGYSPLPTWDNDEVADAAGGHHSQISTSRELRMLRQTSGGHKDQSGNSKVQKMPVVARKSLLRVIVESHAFDVLACTLVLANSCWIGFQTEYMASNWLTEFPKSWDHIEYIFCGIFTAEICIRILALQQDFFFGEEWRWNVFDFTLVFLQVLDVGLGMLVKEANGKLGWVRTIRVVRIFRVVRVLHFIDELRSLVVSIGACVSALFWLMILVCFVTFIFAVVLTQTVTNHKAQRGKDVMAKEGESILDLFGSLDRTLLVLFQLVTDGFDWNSAQDPLADNISQWFSVVFGIYMVFMIIGLMNIATATVVDSSLRVAAEEARSKMINGLWKSFAEQGGDITRDVFDENMCNPHMECFLTFLELDAERAVECDLFGLVDSDGSGSIDKKELVNGCMNLAGTAKSLDLTRLRKVADRTQRNLQQHMDKVDDVLDIVLSRLVPSDVTCPTTRSGPASVRTAR
jgi:phage-related holin